LKLVRRQLSKEIRDKTGGFDDGVMGPLGSPVSLGRQTKKKVRPILSIVPSFNRQSISTSRIASRAILKPTLLGCSKLEWVNWLLNQKRFD
jgi:hypothetical protein